MQKRRTARRVTLIGHLSCLYLHQYIYMYIYTYIYLRDCACISELVTDLTESDFDCCDDNSQENCWTQVRLKTKKILSDKLGLEQLGFVAASHSLRLLVCVCVCVCCCCFKCSDNGPSSSLYSYIPINKCNANIWLSSTIVRWAGRLADWQRGS